MCVCGLIVLFCQTFSGYAFLLFQDESSVQALIDACIQEDSKLYLCVSSPTIKDKPVSLLNCSILSNKYKTKFKCLHKTSDRCFVWSLYATKL